MNKKVLYRISLDILIILSMLNGWWFIALPLGLLGSWRFPYFVEIVIAGIAYDSFFGFVPDLGLWGYAGTVVSVAILLVTAGGKKVVRR